MTSAIPGDAKGGMAPEADQARTSPMAGVGGRTDLMGDPTGSPATQSIAGATGAPRVNPLQKLWLREIGIEKTWLPVAVTPSLEGADASRQAGEAPDRTVRDARASQASIAALSRSPRRDGPAAPASESIPPAQPRPAVVAVRPPAGSSPVRAAAPRVPASTAATSGLVAAGALFAEAHAAVAQAAASASDLEALRAQVEVCTACKLCQGRRHAVFGMGARPARWMVIGEAPGEQEDRQGQPFVGRSGQLLDSMLRAVGMSRDDNVFITNVIKCRPPGNRNPKPEEIAACSPYLKRQIELIQPERILVVGRFAAQTLLGTDATIGSLRGRQHGWTTDAGVHIPVIVSYHPAYLLRSPLEKARAWQDLQLALA